MILLPPISTLFPSTTLFRSRTDFAVRARHRRRRRVEPAGPADGRLLSERDVQRDGLRARGSGSHAALVFRRRGSRLLDRKSTRLNSSHLGISYAVFCLKKKK